MIKFNLYNVKGYGKTVKVYYSINNHISGRNCVTVRTKSIIDSLFPIFGELVKNESDSREDYFEKDRVVIFEGERYYEEALHIAKQKEAKSLKTI